MQGKGTLYSATGQLGGQFSKLTANVQAGLPLFLPSSKFAIAIREHPGEPEAPG